MYAPRCQSKFMFVQTFMVNKIPSDSDYIRFFCYITTHKTRRGLNTVNLKAYFNFLTSTVDPLSCLLVSGLGFLLQ